MKNFLITGISRGLGCEIAREILLNGDAVYGISRTLSDEAKELAPGFPRKAEIAAIRPVRYGRDIEMRI